MCLSTLIVVAHDRPVPELDADLLRIDFRRLRILPLPLPLDLEDVPDPDCEPPECEPSTCDL